MIKNILKVIIPVILFISCNYSGKKIDITHKGEIWETEYLIKIQ